MRCVLIRKEGCLFEQCRYWINHFCVLTTIDESGWPDPECRFKNKNVEVKDDTAETKTA